MEGRIIFRFHREKVLIFGLWIPSFFVLFLNDIFNKPEKSLTLKQFQMQLFLL